ncbi:helix-turn-helix transcriptional regulator [Streptomyces sp. NPDC055239]
MRMYVPAVPPMGSDRAGGNGQEPRDNTFGEFLRTCRSRLAPSDVGLRADVRHRRVAGLRRQEVSVLTGVSADYYARLEQGRKRYPSPRIVEALGRAFHLDPDARGHLFRLAGLNPSLRPDTTRSHAHPELLYLLESSHTAAACVLSPCLDILAANAPAQALLSPFGSADSVADRVGSVGSVDRAESTGSELNLIRILFTHPQARSYFAQWPSAVAVSLHALRLHSARLPGDTEIVDLVADMSAESADFRRKWEAGAAGGLDRRRLFGAIVHPAVGRIELTYRVFSVPEAPGQHLLIGTAPGGRSAEALTYLTAMGGRQP